MHISRVQAIEIEVGDRVIFDQMSHVVTAVDVHSKRGDDLLDGQVRISWRGGNVVVRHNSIVSRVG